MVKNTFRFIRLIIGKLFELQSNRYNRIYDVETSFNFAESYTHDEDVQSYCFVLFCFDIYTR